MSIRITCIKKDSGNHENSHTAISVLGWIEDSTNNTGRSSRIEMYDFVKSGGYAYVKDTYGNKAQLIAETTSWGTKYVKTKPDNTTTDNLLKLSECY
jgi:hypothetical protein